MPNQSPPLLMTHARLATMAEDGGYGLCEDYALLAQNGRIAWLGPSAQAPSVDGVRAHDCGGRLVTPGLIDCHTHLVYGGNRADEFEQRLEGASYEDIAQAGGGILASVRATRAASEAQLVASARPRLEALQSEGVTTVEIKSGYGLDLETELKMLRAARALARNWPVDVVTSYLGAHALPPEYAEARGQYIDFIIDQVLPAVASENLADAVDGFCEKIAFRTDEIQRVFTAATAHNLPVKLHAEQLSWLGGARLAAGHGALSVDHCEYITEADVRVIAEAGCVVTLLPGAFYYLGETRKPPVDGLRRAQAPMAVASDLNPGSSPVHSLLAAMNMACVLFGLTPLEALRGTTVNAARALGLTDRGVIAEGLKADLAVWDIARPGELSYALGYNPCHAVIKDGDIVRGRL